VASGGKAANQRPAPGTEKPRQLQEGGAGERERERERGEEEGRESGEEGGGNARPGLRGGGGEK